MKKEKVEAKLRLNKTTIRNLQNTLDSEEQKKIKGGTEVAPMGTTNIPPLCT